MNVLRHTDVEEDFIKENGIVSLSSKGGSWCDVAAFRAQTMGGVLHFAPQSDVFLTVQTDATPNLVECVAEGRSYREKHPFGAMNLIPAGAETHWLFEHPTDDIVISLPAKLLARVAAESGKSPGSVELILASGKNDPAVERLALLMNSELENKGANGRLFGDGLATTLAAYLLTNYAVFRTIFKEYQRGLSKRDLKRVLDYLHDNLSSDTSLETLAGVVAVSPSHFCALFKRSTGVSPHQYVIKERVERAKKLLMTGEHSIADVASAVGFSDQAHLTRHMKKRLGVTPRRVTDDGKYDREQRDKAV